METCRQDDMRRQKPFHICVFPQAAAFHKNAHAPLTSLNLRFHEGNLTKACAPWPTPTRTMTASTEVKAVMVMVSGHGRKILVVVEDGLGVLTNSDDTQYNYSLNPCCSGKRSRRGLTNAHYHLNL